MEYKELVETISDSIKGLQSQVKTLVPSLEERVDFIIKNEIKDINEIEHLLDDITNFHYILDLECLFYKLNDYFFKVNKKAASWYKKYFIKTFREEKEMKGSKKHIFDFVNEFNFIDIFNDKFKDRNLKLDKNDVFNPNKFDEKEYSIISFCKEYKNTHHFLEKIEKALTGWWVKKGKQPTWDLISTCTIKNKKGLLLVEAKAHKNEFDKGFKKLISTEDKKVENHEQIKKCIEEANDNLPSFSLTTNSHYQLMNRIAFSWKISSLDIPVVLLYLGFIGDCYFEKDYFEDEISWKKTFNQYIDKIVPNDFINNIDSTPFLFFEASI